MSRRASMVFSLLMLLTLVVPRLAAQDSLRVLFIGNSFTYTHNIPQLLAGLAAAGGHPLLADMSAPGGFTLHGHVTHAYTLNKLQERDWDWVVLQEQSQMPVIPWWRRHWTRPAAASLDSLIRLRGAQTMLYMTWGRQFGGQQCVQDSCSVAFRDFQHMQDSLSASYRSLASDLAAAICPVGEVWSQALSQDPFADFWADANGHPTLESAYLNACVFYAAFFSESPVGLQFRPAELDSARAGWLQQQVADELSLEPSPGHRHQAHGLLPPAWPNPFNPVLQVPCLLPHPAHVRLELRNLLGQLHVILHDGPLPAGRHVFTWHPAGLSSGCYILTMNMGGKLTESRTVTLLR